MRILVTGASGLVGKNFIRHALREGHEIRALVRRPDKFRMLPDENVYKWDQSAPPDERAFLDVDAVVHLAGENIAGARWSSQRKRALVDSRVGGTRQIVEALRGISPNRRPRTFVSASAIGIYGYKREAELTEASAPGEDFLAKLCIDWEAEAGRAQDLGMRVAQIRTGIVLAKEGGALAKMPPVKISDGQSWMSWIHVHDMARALLFILQSESVSGPVNMVAPNPSRNGEFIQAMAKAQGVPAVGFVPEFVLRVALGEVANVLLSSLLVRPKRLLEAGFKFLYPQIDLAIADVLGGRHVLDRVVFKDQFVPLEPEQIFPFFSRAENLETLTPPWLNFRITSKSTDQVERGTLIDYKLSIHGAPVTWRTRILDWRPNEYFVDDQLAGPYSKWHHLHAFDRVTGGCLLRDEITYRIPGSVLGRLFLSSWIAKDVTTIFDFRQKRIVELLKEGALTGPANA